jgi:hypothetical protein
MMRAVLTVLAIVALFVTGTTAAFAWPERIEGHPELNAAGYYFWHNDNGLHLRTHGTGVAHEFVARLHTDGVFHDVDTVRLESGDKFAVTDGGHTLIFKVHTYNATDGVNFKIAGGRWLRLDLELNGSQIDTGRIFLGDDEVNPNRNPFVVWR